MLDSVGAVLEGWDPRSVAETEDAEVLQSALEHVDQLVVPIGIGRRHEEARPEHVIVSVGDDAFDRLAVMEADADPKPLHHRGVLVEMKRAVAKIAVKGHHEEDGLGVRCRDLLNLASLKGQADGVQGVLRVIAEELLDGANFACRSEAAQGVILKANDDFIGRWSRGQGGPRRRGVRGCVYACP